MACPRSCFSPARSSFLFFGIQGPRTKSVAAVPECRRLRSLVIALGLLLLLSASSYGQDVVNRWDLRPERPAAEMRFGWSVALEDEIIVVGAPGDTANGPKAGAAYVFEWTDGDEGPAGALWIELKSESGRLRDSQRQWRTRLVKNRHAWTLCRSLDAFTAAVRAYVEGEHVQEPL